MIKINDYRFTVSCNKCSTLKFFTMFLICDPVPSQDDNDILPGITIYK